MLIPGYVEPSAGATPAPPRLDLLRRRLATKAGPVQVAPPPPGVEPARWAAAIHEAGHAVVGVATGGNIESLAIHGTDGECAGTHPWDTPTVRRVAYALGGAEAESTMARTRPFSACVSPVDRRYAEAEIRGSKSPDAVWNAGRGLAAAILRKNRETVTRTARALAFKGQLDAAEIRVLLQAVAPMGGVTKS